MSMQIFYDRVCKKNDLIEEWNIPSPIADLIFSLDCQESKIGMREGIRINILTHKYSFHFILCAIAEHHKVHSPVELEAYQLNANYKSPSFYTYSIASNLSQKK